MQRKRSRGQRISAKDLSSVLQVAVSPDGKWFATCGFIGYPYPQESFASVWEVATGMRARDIVEYSDVKCEVSSVAWSPDGSLLAISSGICSARLVDAHTGAHVRLLECQSRYEWDKKNPQEIHISMVRCVAWSPDGRRLATGSRDAAVRLWDVATGTTLRVLEGHTDTVSSVAWAPDGNSLATGSKNCSMRLWDCSVSLLDVEFAAYSRVLQSGHTRQVYSVSWSADGSLLASASADETVIVWNTASYTRQHTITAYRVIAWWPHGNLLAFIAGDNDVGLWDAATSSVQDVLKFVGMLRDGVISSLAWSPCGDLLFAGTEDANVCLLGVAASALRKCA